MSQPPPYARSYSFTDFATAQPTSPPPGIKLDGEFDNLQATIQATLANLAKIQRDDGGLANGSVGSDQLADSVLALIASTGDPLVLAQLTAVQAASAASAAQAAGSATGAAASATVSTTNATTAMQAAVAAQGAVGLLTSSVSSGGALPYEVTALSGAFVGTGTGGTPGEYALTVTGGPSGHTAFITIGAGGTIASARIGTRGIATASTLPSYALPAGTGMTGATLPTATVTALAAGRVFLAPDATGTFKLGWQSSGGVIAAWNVGGVQYGEALASTVNNLITNLSQTTTQATGTFPVPTGATIYNAGDLVRLDSCALAGASISVNVSPRATGTIKFKRLTLSGGTYTQQASVTKTISSVAPVSYTESDLAALGPWAAGDFFGFYHSGCIGRDFGTPAGLGIRYSGSTSDQTSFAAATDPGSNIFGVNATWSKTTQYVTTAAFLAAKSDISSISTIINGSMTMDKLIEGSGSGSTSLYRGLTFVSGSTYVITYELKAGERNRVNVFCNTGALIDVTVNLATGGISIGSSGTTAVLTALNNGCYRLVVTRTATAPVFGNIQLRMYPEAGGHPYVGDGASGLFINSATLTVNGGANIWTFSTDFTNAAWTKQAMTVLSKVGKWLGLPTITGSTAGTVTAHPLTGKKVALVGTSLVAQGFLTSALAGETGATIQQLGYSGGALGLDARGSPHYGSGQVTALLPSIASDVNAIILDMCVNDVAASDVPLGAVTDTTTATYCGALANFFIYCETNFPNIAVVVVVPTSAGGSYTPSDYRHGVANANGNFLEDFQNATRRMADYYGRPYIDPNRYGIGFLDSGQNTSDQLHWDDSGALKAAKVYSKQLRDLCDAGWLTY